MRKEITITRSMLSAEDFEENRTSITVDLKKQRILIPDWVETKIKAQKDFAWMVTLYEASKQFPDFEPFVVHYQTV